VGQSLGAPQQAGGSGVVRIEKEFVEKKPHTMVRLTEAGRIAFKEYRNQMHEILSTISERKLIVRVCI
jgi:DNA-binding PadR family transcriptional regulator